MGKSYSADLRARVQAHVAAGHSRREASRHFDVSPSFAVKLAKRVEKTGSIAPARQGRPPGGGKVTDHLAQLIQWVEAEPDITMPELAAKLAATMGVIAHPASLSRVLLAAGFSFKKNTDGIGVRTRRRSP
jgi:transposase